MAAYISLIVVSIFIFKGTGLFVTVLSETVYVFPRNTTPCRSVADPWTRGENGLQEQHSETSSVTLAAGT